MAEVWVARRASLGASKTVAIKLLAPNLAAKPEYRRMFVEEARISMLLNNSRLVQVFDAGEYGGECYIAMEWIDGVNLAEIQTVLWEQGRRLPVEIAMFITGEVLRALHYAHNLVHEGASSIVHRDVSPQNVMLSMAGEVKLADFGVARFSTEETTGLHVKGKLRYMAPEQLQGNSRGATVDVFAVGAILHEMLEGRKFRGPTTDDAQLLSMIFAGGTPELSDDRGVPAELDVLRRSMLKVEAHQRITSALAAVQQLERCPGYRNMSLDLEMLVREHRTLTACDSNWRPGRSTGSFAQIMPVMNEHQLRDTSVSRRVAYGVNPSTGTERRASRRAPAHRERRMAAAAIVALAGLGVGSLGIGIAMNGVGAESNEPETPRRLAGRAQAMVDALPRAELEPEDESPVLVPPPTPALPPTLEPEIESAASPKIESRPAPPPKPKRVKVTIASGEFLFLYLKIGSKVHTLQPALKDGIRLTPGKHTMQIRETASAKWRSVVVEIPKQACHVAFKKNLTVRVTLL